MPNVQYYKEELSDSELIGLNKMVIKIIVGKIEKLKSRVKY